MKEFVYKGNANGATSVFYTIEDAKSLMEELVLSKNPSLTERRSVGAIAGARAEEAPEEAWEWMRSFGENVCQEGLVFFFLGLVGGSHFGKMRQFLDTISEQGEKELCQDLQWLEEWVAKDVLTVIDWVESRKFSPEVEWEIDKILGGQDPKRATELLKKWGHQAPYLAGDIVCQISKRLGPLIAMEWMRENVTDEMLERSDMRAPVIIDWIEDSPVVAKAWIEALPDEDKWKEFMLKCYHDNMLILEELGELMDEQ